MAIRAYSGTARPVDSVYEGRAGFRTVEWDDADGSVMRGYQRLADSALIGGACMVVSPARQTVLDAINAANAAENTSRANFIQSMIDLAQKVKANTATAVEQRLLLTKLTRAVLAIYSDL